MAGEYRAAPRETKENPPPGPGYGVRISLVVRTVRPASSRHT
jgi:hypothetical protein